MRNKKCENNTNRCLQDCYRRSMESSKNRLLRAVNNVVRGLFADPPLITLVETGVETCMDIVQAFPDI